MQSTSIVAFLTLLLCSSSLAQDDNSMTLQPEVLEATESTCPPDELIAVSRGRIQQSVFQLLSSSCAVIYQLNPNAPSGYYSLNGTQVYCDNGERWSRPGGWFRIAYLNMTDPTQSCPSAWRFITSPMRMCGRAGSNCQSATFSSLGQSYSQVCGRLIGYQFGSTEAFWYYNNRNQVTIDDPYVDAGVSITHGSPRQHIWSLASGHSQVAISTHDCRCNNGNEAVLVPPWVGDDYFCDSGNPNPSPTSILYLSDPLWDGAGCGSSNTCCEFNNPPWFCKQLPQPTTDDIEVRLCGDESPSSNEDTPLELIELYAQ